mmetsp:Transcript_30188/g.97072  ORF Transcript_30188/g.97072 Transcript_30188/m.97072 type:complete len:332 (-) Transcript_30188:113-1108(-)
MHVLIAVASLHGSVDPHAKAPSIPVMGVPVMNGLTLLDQLVTSIDHPVHKLVLVHNLDDGQPNAEVCAWTARMRKSPPNHVKQVSVVTYRENLGCAAAWNTIMLQNQQSPWWLIVNADVSFRPGTLRTIASHVWAGLLASTPGGRDPVCNWLFHGWSAFALANRALHRVGTFDENFWPAYSEDCDYQARLVRSGCRSDSSLSPINPDRYPRWVHPLLKIVSALTGSVSIAHETSSTFKANSSSRLHRTVKSGKNNNDYLSSKWGTKFKYCQEGPLQTNATVPIRWRLDKARRRKRGGPPRCVACDAHGRAVRAGQHVVIQDDSEQACGSTP